MRLEQERLEIAQNVLDDLGDERTLNKVQARSFVRCLQATWNVEQIYWGEQESGKILADAMRLVHAGQIFSDTEGPSSARAQMSYRRVGELLEWLSRVEDSIHSTAPTLLLASAAYQLSGLPAMATGLQNQVDYRSSGEELYGLFLGADFDGVINATSKFWRKNKRLTIQNYRQRLLAEEGGFDMSWYITVELVRALGLISDSLMNRPGSVGDHQLK